MAFLTFVGSNSSSERVPLTRSNRERERKHFANDDDDKKKKSNNNNVEQVAAVKSVSVPGPPTDRLWCALTFELDLDYWIVDSERVRRLKSYVISPGGVFRVFGCVGASCRQTLVACACSRQRSPINQ